LFKYFLSGKITKNFFIERLFAEYFVAKVSEAVSFSFGYLAGFSVYTISYSPTNYNI